MHRRLKRPAALFNPAAALARSGNQGWTTQVPPEVYDLFGAAQKKGEKAEEEWKATMAKYQEKYPEVRAGANAPAPPSLCGTR